MARTPNNRPAGNAGRPAGNRNAAAAGAAAGASGRSKRAPRAGKSDYKEIRGCLAVYCGCRFICPGILIMLTGITFTVLANLPVDPFDTDDHRTVGPIFIAVGVLVIALTIVYICLLTGCKKKNRKIDPGAPAEHMIRNEPRQMQPRPMPQGGGGGGGDAPPSYNDAVGSSTGAAEHSPSAGNQHPSQGQHPTPRQLYGDRGGGSNAEN